MREELGLAYAVYTFQSFHADAGMHRRLRRRRRRNRPARRWTRSATSCARVVAQGLPADELAMGRQQLKGQVTLSLESVVVADVSRGAVELYDEPYRSLDELLALIDAITVGGRRARWLAEFFAPERQYRREARPARLAGPMAPSTIGSLSRRTITTHSQSATAP